MSADLESKRPRAHVHVGKDYFFRRVVPETAGHASGVPARPHIASQAQSPASPLSSTVVPGKPNGIPQIVATQPGDENTLFSQYTSREHITNGSKNGSDSNLQGSVTAAPPRLSIPATTVPQQQPPRRFHLSVINNTQGHSPFADSITHNHRASSTKQRNLGPRDNDAAVVVFVEERHVERPRASDIIMSDGALLQTDAGVPDVDMSGSNIPTKTRRRPGASAGIPRQSKPARLQPTQKEAMAQAEMHEALLKYAHEEISESKQDKAPIRDGGGADADAMDMDDDTYVFDTYVRAPLPAIRASSTMDTFSMHGLMPAIAATDPSSVGVLVVPEGSSADFFYSADSDEDEKEGDWDSEQDDENAENYYGADYPEEEVRSDDGGEYLGYTGGEEFSTGWDHEEESSGAGWAQKQKAWGWDNGGSGSRSRRRGHNDTSGDDGSEEDEID